MQRLIDRYRPVVSRLKASGELRIVDSHVHAADVLNVLDLSHYVERPEQRCWSLEGSMAHQPRPDRVELLARLRYTRLRSRVEGIAFSLMPGLVVSTIRQGFAHLGPRRLADEMAVSGVDAVALLTLPPASDIDAVHPIYGRERVHYLGSVDLHAIESDEVPAEVARQRREFGIVGLKLHPNLQGFYPVPDDNPAPLAERLRRVYSAAEELGLYVLLHSGRSHLLPASLQTGGHARVREVAREDCAVLERYCDAAGRSRLFERHGCPFVLAHLASFGVPAPDIPRMAAAAARYPHLHFDTSGVWSGHIARAVELIGVDRILFGSDGLYNLQLLELVSCLRGVELGSRRGRFEPNAAQVLGGNFARLISP